MIATAIIFAILVVGGAIVYLLDKDGRHRTQPSEENELNAASGHSNDEGCCGMHLTCEKDSLSTAMSTEVVYYEDEELDVYAHRSGEDYTTAETEQFRDILLTLLPEDIAGWARSLQLRSIPLPPEVSDELMLIVREARANRAFA